MITMFRSRIAYAVLWLALVAALSQPAAAQLPDAATFLAEIGFNKDQIARVEAGGFVDVDIQPSTPREIVAAFAFLVKESPTDLVNQLRAGRVGETDPNMVASEEISGAPTPGHFAKLTLQPDATKRTQAYLGARPGDALNLSSEEIAAFRELGSGAGAAAVEQAIRSALLARLQAYQSQGLAGIAPYARASGGPRSPGDELRSATQATRRLQQMVPKAHDFLVDYPASRPPGTEESFRWSNMIANGTPTIALLHSVYVPDGDSWVAAQRQFYVSTGYNSEQGIAALLPMKTGTLVVYTNRTSTDQVTGLGGGAKRSIGSRLLDSQLKALYQKVRAAGDKKSGG
jgi:hypothetical protein